jgi:hypothetical protein
MDNTYELNALRSIREATIAIRDLENQATATAKRYKKGVKNIYGYISTIEASLDDGGTIEGMEPWNSISPSLKRLLSNPIVDNIEEDSSI